MRIPKPGVPAALRRDPEHGAGSKDPGATRLWPVLGTVPPPETEVSVPAGRVSEMRPGPLETESAPGAGGHPRGPSWQQGENGSINRCCEGRPRNRPSRRNRQGTFGSEYADQLKIFPPGNRCPDGSGRAGWERRQPTRRGGRQAVARGLLRRFLRLTSHETKVGFRPTDGIAREGFRALRKAMDTRGLWVTASAQADAGVLYGDAGKRRDLRRRDRRCGKA